MSFKISNYFLPTPKFIKHTADAILATLGTSGLVCTLLEVYPNLSNTMLITAVFSKLVSNFFSNIK